MRYYSVLTIFILSIMIIGTASAGVDSINYPRNNDIISETARINLNVSSTAVSNCVFYYTTSNGAVPYNQSVLCNGISLVNLPNADGNYNISVQADGGSSVTNVITVDKPNGILITLIYVLTFFVLFSGLFFFVINLAKLATVSTTIFDVALSWSIYFGVLISYQMVIEYSNVPFIIGWLDLMRVIGGWVLFVLPLIAFFITFFFKGMKKKSLPSIKDMTGRSPIGYGD